MWSRLNACASFVGGPVVAAAQLVAGSVRRMNNAPADTNEPATIVPSPPRSAATTSVQSPAPSPPATSVRSETPRRRWLVICMGALAAAATAGAVQFKAISATISRSIGLHTHTASDAASTAKTATVKAPYRVQIPKRTASEAPARPEALSESTRTQPPNPTVFDHFKKSAARALPWYGLPPVAAASAIIACRGLNPGSAVKVSDGKREFNVKCGEQQAARTK